MNPVFLGQGQIFPQLGLVTGQNRNGDQISGHRVEPGHWELTNQNNGTQLDVDVNFVGPNKHLANVDITKTDANGNQTTNDVTLLRGQGRRFLALDLNKSGFQTIS